MATEIDMGILSYMSYVPGSANELALAGWASDDALLRAKSSGFAASVYTKGSEVVIAFRGTDAPELLDFWTGNVPAGRGSYSTQVMDAIELVSDAIDKYGKENISFTGHSLGGGLASLMAVFFDLPATVFDPAPFALTARSEVVPIVPGPIPVVIPVPLWSTVLSAYEQDYIFYQSSHGGRDTDSSFLAYANTFAILSGNSQATRDALFNARSNNVTGKYLEGEILVAARAVFPTVMSPGGLTQVNIGQTTLNDNPISTEGAGDATTLHSMALLLAMMASPKLQQASQQLPKMLELVMDETLYARPRSATRETNFLTRLTNDQLRDGVSTTGEVLDKFADDLLKLGGTDGIAKSDTLLRDALMIAAIEYYNFKDLSQATSLFTVADGAIHFKYSDIGASAYKSLPKLAAAAAIFGDGADPGLVKQLEKKNAWHIQIGDGGMSWIGSAENDVAVGGFGSDSISAGAGDDILIGGVGMDALEGGAGSDRLYGGFDNDFLYGNEDQDYLDGGFSDDYLDGGSANDTLKGGAGYDTYVYRTGDGRDTIIGDDNDGEIHVNGDVLTGTGATLYTTIQGRMAWHATINGHVYNYVLANGDITNGGRLEITGFGITSGDYIAIENFKPGDLGLNVPTAAKTALLPGLSTPTQSVFSDPNYVPTTLATNLKEGLSQTISLALNLPTIQGQVIRFAFEAACNDELFLLAA